MSIMSSALLLDVGRCAIDDDRPSFKYQMRSVGSGQDAVPASHIIFDQHLTSTSTLRLQPCEMAVRDTLTVLCGDYV